MDDPVPCGQSGQIGHMHDRTKYTLPEVLAAVEKGRTKTGTAEVLDCSRSTIKAYAKRWKAVADAFDDKRLEIVDLAEVALLGAVVKGEPWAITFTLKTLGRDVYAERLEHTGKGGQEIVIREVIIERIERTGVSPTAAAIEGAPVPRGLAAPTSVDLVVEFDLPHRGERANA